MDYTDDLVSEIAVQYALVISCIEKLREVKKDKEGAVMGWVSESYEKAYKAMLFLKATPKEVQKRLKIVGLEKELLDFGNTHIRL